MIRDFLTGKEKYSQNIVNYTEISDTYPTNNGIFLKFFKTFVNEYNKIYIGTRIPNEIPGRKDRNKIIIFLRFLFINLQFTSYEFLRNNQTTRHGLK